MAKAPTPPPRKRPWLGWVMLFEDRTDSDSHGTCYEQILHKFTHERLFDAAALLASPEKGAAQGALIEPVEDLSMRWFLASLLGWVGGYMAATKFGTRKSDESRSRWAGAAVAT